MLKVKWLVTHPAAQHYVTNSNTGIQYRWNGTTWQKSYEGIYQQGRWTLVLPGGSEQYRVDEDTGQSGSGSSGTYK